MEHDGTCCCVREQVSGGQGQGGEGQLTRQKPLEGGWGGERVGRGEGNAERVTGVAGRAESEVRQQTKGNRQRERDGHTQTDPDREAKTHADRERERWTDASASPVGAASNTCCASMPGYSFLRSVRRMLVSCYVRCPKLC